jgi:ubiquinone/menaquinone biosynthesis C-methylase UbiE
MRTEKRVNGQLPEDWAHSLGANRHPLWQLFSQVRFRRRMQKDSIWGTVSSYMHPGDRILDAGCGMGNWVVFLNEAKMTADGIDFSPNMVGLLTQRWPRYNWMEGRIQSIPTPDNTYDHVISWGVIEHDPAGPDAALSEFYRVLKPGGYAFVTVPVDSVRTRRLSEIECPEDPRASFFQFAFTLEECADFLERNHFELILTKLESRHYATIFPRFSIFMQKRGRIRNAVLQRVMKPIMNFVPDSYLMILGIARKPLSREVEAHE